MKKEPIINQTSQIIQEMRLRAGLTQQSLAEALHVTDKAVSKWERGLGLPDTVLLPKLALILDVDLDVLLSMSVKKDEWVGLVDIKDCDFSQIIYDKPLIYYILSHYLLLGINKVHIITNNQNEKYLSNAFFEKIGFSFSFELPKNKNVMLINYPWFLFGSDLTQQFQGAMLLNRTVKLIPEKQSAVFYFVLKDKIDLIRNQKLLDKKITSRTLGRGMLLLDMANYDKNLDVASFVRIYQNNSKMLIGCLEEIAYKKGYISIEQLRKMVANKPYSTTIFDDLGKL